MVLHDGEQFYRDLVDRGSLERMTLFPMTAISAEFALMPLIIAADEPGREFLHPFAVTIFDGLISAEAPLPKGAKIALTGNHGHEHISQARFVIK